MTSNLRDVTHTILNEEDAEDSQNNSQLKQGKTNDQINSVDSALIQ